jgi:pimeloyl-ACP methyl ester carboxylesterase
VVIVADGSGGLPGPSGELARLVGCCTGLRVEVFGWSHGTGRIFSDLYGHGHHRSCGQELAGQVLAQRQTCPTERIVLVGHSSGAAVVLAAAECLPPGSVDRIILLAPAVSASYDLRPALRCACQGIDSFHSHKDLISHSLMFVGTADNQFFGFAAGCIGFRTVAGCCGDDALYANLRQYPDCFGGHFRCTQAAFLRDQVLPLLLTCTATAVAPEPPAGAPVPAIPLTPTVSQVHSASYTPAAAPKGPPPQPGRGGVAPISDSLRIP